jgi:hypothetical protein
MALPWEQHKDVLIGLYSQHTLDQVVEIMEGQYGFKAKFAVPLLSNFFFFVCVCVC